MFNLNKLFDSFCKNYRIEFFLIYLKKENGSYQKEVDFKHTEKNVKFPQRLARQDPTIFSGAGKEEVSKDVIFFPEKI